MYFSHLCVSAFTSIPLMDASLYAGASSRKTSQTYEVVRVRVPLVLLRINSVCSGDPTIVVRTEFRVSLNGVVLLRFFFFVIVEAKNCAIPKICEKLPSLHYSSQCYLPGWLLPHVQGTRVNEYEDERNHMLWHSRSPDLSLLTEGVDSVLHHCHQKTN